jgi:peroxiredoxin
MTLEDELAKRRRLVAETMPAADLRQIAEEIERLRMMQLAESSLQTGDTLPDLALPDTTGQIHTGEELTSRGPLVLVFFRGAWCPYCDVAFGQVEAARPEIENAGALLVGVCPDRPDVLHQSAIVERGARYLLLTDPGGDFARLCGLRWEASEDHVAFLKRISVDLPTRHDDTSWTLPIPASYIVDRQGVVRFAYANADWGQRAAPEAIVARLRELAQAGG